MGRKTNNKKKNTYHKGSNINTKGKYDNSSRSFGTSLKGKIENATDEQKKSSNNYKGNYQEKKTTKEIDRNWETCELIDYFNNVIKSTFNDEISKVENSLDYYLETKINNSKEKNGNFVIDIMMKNTKKKILQKNIIVVINRNMQSKFVHMVVVGGSNVSHTLLYTADGADLNVFKTKIDKYIPTIVKSTLGILFKSSNFSKENKDDKN